MDSHSVPPHRARMPVRIFRLGEEPLDDLTATTTAAERIEMVIQLSARMLLFGGLPSPVYARHDMPVHVMRRI